MTLTILIILVPSIIWTMLMFWRLGKAINALGERLDKVIEPAIVLVSEETKRKVKHTEAFENLVDPDKIQAEMERGADIIEARQANRLLAPRPDAGPPARVFRPKLVGKRASFWNPPRP